MPLNSPSHLEALSYADWKTEWDSSFPKNPEFSSLVPSMNRYLEQLGINTVIRQTDYTDLDYSAAYTRFYSSCFRPPSQACTRYIFFKASFRSVHEIHNPAVVASFCGFTTVWPTYPKVIGGSVLPFPGDPSGRIVADAPYRIHVAGEELELASAMFASKDHAVSVCASVGTWLATDLLHRKFDLNTCSSAEITLRATAGDPKWGRPFPQEYGLTTEQIIRALWSLDYGPVIYYYSPAFGGLVRDHKWLGHLYGYISSGFPVIISLEVDGCSHVVLAVGLQTLEGTPEPHHPDSVGYSFTRLVDSVIVHDDRWGCFSVLRPKGTNPGSLDVTLHHYGDPTDKKSAQITALIVPLPQAIVTGSRHAHALGVDTLKTVIQEKMGKNLPGYNGPFRTVAHRSIDFKKDCLKWDSSLQGIARKFRALAMPRWVWVTEAYPPETSAPTAGSPIARVVIDATQLRFNKDRLILAWHVGPDNLWSA